MPQAEYSADEIGNIGDDLPDWFVSAMARPREEGVTQIGDTAIHYFRWGQRDKPPVIFLHGFLAHRRCWTFIAPLLAKKYDLIALDLSGMGDSDAAEDYSLTARMNEVAGFIAAQNFSEKPFLVAHSYGGGLGIHLTKQQPELLRALLVCDTMMITPDRLESYVKGDIGPPVTNATRQPIEKARPKIYPDWPTIRSRFRLAPEQKCVCPFLFEYMAKHSVKQVEGGWTWKFDPQITVRDQDDRMLWVENTPVFLDLTLPKAIIHGEKSGLFDRTTRDYLAANSKTAFPIIQITNAHHHVMLDQPIALAAAIDSILSTWVAIK